MPLRTGFVALLGTVVLGAPAAQAAPVVHIDPRRTCYYGTGTGTSRRLADTIKLIATGFPPNVPVTVAANETPLAVIAGTPRADSAGNVYLGVRSPPPPNGEQIFWLNVMGAGQAAGHVISVTDFGAVVTPARSPARAPSRRGGR